MDQWVSKSSIQHTQFDSSVWISRNVIAKTTAYTKMIVQPWVLCSHFSDLYSSLSLPSPPIPPLPLLSGSLLLILWGNHSSAGLDPPPSLPSQPLPSQPLPLTHLHGPPSHPSVGKQLVSEQYLQPRFQVQVGPPTVKRSTTSESTGTRHARKWAGADMEDGQLWGLWWRRVVCLNNVAKNHKILHWGSFCSNHVPNNCGPQLL